MSEAQCLARPWPGKSEFADFRPTAAPVPALLEVGRTTRRRGESVTAIAAAKAEIRYIDVPFGLTVGVFGLGVMTILRR